MNNKDRMRIDPRARGCMICKIIVNHSIILGLL